MRSIGTTQIKLVENKSSNRLIIGMRLKLPSCGIELMNEIFNFQRNSTCLWPHLSSLKINRYRDSHSHNKRIVLSRTINTNLHLWRRLDRQNPLRKYSKCIMNKIRFTHTHIDHGTCYTQAMCIMIRPVRHLTIFNLNSDRMSL